MATVRRWFQTSLLAQGLIALCGVAALTWLLPPDDPIAVWALKCLLYTGISIAFFAWRRRKDSQAAGVEEGRVLSLDRRIRKEDVPHDPQERADMSRVLSQREEALHRMRWGVPVFLGIAQLPAVLFALAGQWPMALAWLAFGVAFSAFILAGRRRLRRKLDRMRSALTGEV